MRAVGRGGRRDGTTPRESLIVPLRVPARARLVFPIASVVLVVVCVVWMAVEPSWEAFLVGGLLIGCLAWVWGLKFTLRERRAGAAQLTLTNESLTSPAFTLSWDRIESVRIGYTHAQAGHLRALYIEPFRAADVHWKQGLCDSPRG